MPIYEYVCKNCGHTLEVLQGIDEAPLQKCSECQQLKLEKLLSAPAFHLKGTGWYATDFKNPTKKSASEGTENKEKKSDEKKEVVKSTETKSEKTD